MQLPQNVPIELCNPIQGELHSPRDLVVIQIFTVYKMHLIIISFNAYN